jgi:hypothetical protein
VRDAKRGLQEQVVLHASAADVGDESVRLASHRAVLAEALSVGTVEEAELSRASAGGHVVGDDVLPVPESDARSAGHLQLPADDAT